MRTSTLFKQECLINGNWSSATDGANIKVYNPANNQEIGSVPDLSHQEIESAINAAQEALGPWRQRTAAERSQILKRWHDLVIAHQDELADIMCAEQGKPLSEAKGEITYAASFIDWYAEEAKRIYGESIPAPLENLRMSVQREAIGVCAAITPWNFPAAMITRKVAPALAAGCTMIVRPAELTPFSGLALAALGIEAGIPAGVLQVVTGDAQRIGQVLCESNTVRKLSFTGSTRVGRLLMAQCAPSLKKLSLELGGNAPFIVFDDADLDAAVAGAISSKYRNAGQTCICANRIYVHKNIADVFTNKLADAIKAFKVGPGTEANVTIGPLINQAAVEKVEAHIADAVDKGAEIQLGGERHALGGCFFQPTLLTGVTKDMRIANEETFGPLAPIFTFNSEEEVIEQANDTIYGLAAYFYTRDHARSIRVSEALEYGMIGHNTGLISNAVAPFGGIKQSGLGREGSHHGINEYLELKYVCSAIGD